MSDQVNSDRRAVAQHLMFVSGFVQRLLRNEAKGLDVRWTALMVLKDLQLLGPTSQRTLAKIEQMAAPTMTVLLGQMEARGWIRRDSVEADARVSSVTITPAGREELKKSGQTLRRRLEAELAAVPPPVLRNLQGDLAALADQIMKNIHRPAP